MVHGDPFAALTHLNIQNKELFALPWWQTRWFANNNKRADPDADARVSAAVVQQLSLLPCKGEELPDGLEDFYDKVLEQHVCVSARSTIGRLLEEKQPSRGELVAIIWPLLQTECKACETHT
eukprot:TRINITY_DN8180_c0_g1_i1.p1 TRINITY_DN8180_c0_g1~~TRINITY_DN8180_c0_g1_i1.p1  ORF type:complete len:122 (+),score=17.11 TRINITY_DN8180_c0_g1_i1:765-1130(+)